MPSFSFSSSLRAASQEHVLRLNVTHNLMHGSPSHPTRISKGRVPKELDVLWLSDVIISFSGSLGAVQIPAHDIVRSGLVRNFLVILKTNADRLGLNNASCPFVDDVDGLCKLTLTPSRPLPQPSRSYVNLVSLHLAYIWKSVTGQNDIHNSDRLVKEASPFSDTLFLPAEILLNRVTEQFLVYHFVGRYPLVFGPWCKRLDLEMQYFPSIGRSIVEIMTRSGNRVFLSKCKRLLKVMRTRHKFALQACATALSTCVDDGAFESQENQANTPATHVFTDEQVLCECLEQLFRMRVRQRRFKPAETPQRAIFPQDEDDDSLLQSVIDERIDNEASWVELFDTCASLGDYSQSLSEDVDILGIEDWPEGTGHVHEADVDTMFLPSETITRETQSDESLIDASASTTSIPPMCTNTHYHHQYTGCCELHPTAGGPGNSYSQTAHMEESGTSALFPTLAVQTLHDDIFSNEPGEQSSCFQDDFEMLDSSSEGDKGGDSDSMLLELANGTEDIITY